MKNKLKNLDMGTVKTVIIGLVAVVVLFFGAFVYVNSYPNKAYRMEQQIEEQKSNITIQEKKRNDILVNLVDTVEASVSAEKETLLLISEARSSAKAGDIDSVSTMVSVISEQYPELKSQEGFRKVENEIIINTDTVTNYQKQYNSKVSEYNQLNKNFISGKLLKLAGYEFKTYERIEFQGYETISNLWD